MKGADQVDQAFAGIAPALGLAGPGPCPHNVHTSHVCKKRGGEGGIQIQFKGPICVGCQRERAPRGRVPRPPQHSTARRAHVGAGSGARRLPLCTPSTRRVRLCVAQLHAKHASAAGTAWPSSMQTVPQQRTLHLAGVEALPGDSQDGVRLQGQGGAGAGTQVVAAPRRHRPHPSWEVGAGRRRLQRAEHARPSQSSRGWRGARHRGQAPPQGGGAVGGTKCTAGRQAEGTAARHRGTAARHEAMQGSAHLVVQVEHPEGIGQHAVRHRERQPAEQAEQGVPACGCARAGRGGRQRRGMSPQRTTARWSPAGCWKECTS